MTTAAPGGLVEQARVFVPSRTRPEVLAMRPGGSAAAAQAGQVAYMLREGVCELADVCGALAARDDPSQTLVYELASMYGWDAPIMQWAYDWAMEHGVGTRFELTDGGA